MIEDQAVGAAVDPAVDTAVDTEEALRADLYDFLSALLARPPDQSLIDRAAALTGDASPLGEAIATLARVARATTAPKLRREFDRLFIGLGRGEVVPYASFYMTGFLYEKPLARLRGDMGRLMIERTAEVFEPEDGIAPLCEMMAGLIRGRFGPPAPLARQKEFFGAHIAPWAGHFFSDLEAAESAVFYAPVGRLGRLFVGIEQEAFRMEG